MMYFKKRLWDELMLETSEERIELLKAGLTGKMVGSCMLNITVLK